MIFSYVRWQAHSNERNPKNVNNRNTMSKISIIAGREFTERVRKKSFIFTTILMPIVFIGIMFVPMLMNNIQSETKEIIVVDQSGIVADRLQSSTTIKFTSSEGTAEQIADVPGILHNIETSAELKMMWDKYRKQFAYAKEIEYMSIMTVLRQLLL